MSTLSKCPLLEFLRYAINEMKRTTFRISTRINKKRFTVKQIRRLHHLPHSKSAYAYVVRVMFFRNTLFSIFNLYV